MNAGNTNVFEDVDYKLNIIQPENKTLPKVLIKKP
jgi:hypothetical protein